MDENTYLTAIENAHRERTGSFCYVATQSDHSHWAWRMSVVERGVDGHYPLSDDYFAGDEHFMKSEAHRLNERLGVSPSQQVEIICSSMQAAMRSR